MLQGGAASAPQVYADAVAALLAEAIARLAEIRDSTADAMEEVPIVEEGGASSATVDTEAAAGEVDPISKSVIQFQRIFGREPDSMEEIMTYYESSNKMNTEDSDESDSPRIEESVEATSIRDGNDVDSDESEKGDRRRGREEGGRAPLYMMLDILTR